MESKTQKETELVAHKRSYWEFGLVVVIAVVMIAAVGVLGFLLTETLAKEGTEKVSIQTVSVNAKPSENQSSSKEAAVEEVKKTDEAKEVEVKEVNPLDVAIKILNGGGVGGSAGKVKEALVAKGYKKLEVGNSEKNSYAGMTVFYQAENKAVADKIVTDLKAKYPTIQAKAGVSAEEKSGAIVVIIGR